MLRDRSSKPVATWLLIGVVMIIIQIILGGITRLTGSGLSITEWDVVTGTIPPVTEQQWTEAFAKYKTTEQFKQLNSDFTLPDFKFIFFWEWFHRFWGRLIGVVFAIPFIIFIIQKRFRREHILPLVVLFILGGLQGAVGWIMVASGLTGDAVYVRPTKLAMHFVLALILLFYTYWFYLKFKVRRESLVTNRALKTFTWSIIVLFYVQLFYGALMAGHKAAVYAPTWPTINYSWSPDIMFEKSPESLSAQQLRDWQTRKAVITTHFIHRMTAYLLVLLIIVWSVQAFRIKPTQAFSKTRWLPLFFVLLQTTLGVLTVVTSVHIRAYIWNEFEWMAQLHQLVALFLLLSLAHAAFLLSTQQKANLS